MTTQAFDMVEKDKKYQVHLACADCGHILNTIDTTTGEDISRRWTGLVTSAGFVAGKCPNNCRATYSDLNLNTDMLIWDVEQGSYLEKNNWKFWDRLPKQND